tara:strand:+ start:630 stop:1115 length:486 start_codon:yes stop_codon:yes gene_type:complete
MNITKITKNNEVILKNKDNNTIYRVNKVDSLVTFKGHDYNIDDNATARNLIYMLIDKCAQDDDLIDDYKTVLKNKEEEIKRLTSLSKDYISILRDKEKSHNECRKTNVRLRDKNKQLERDIRQSDNNLGECLDNIKAIEKEKNKIEDSIKIFFRLNEKIIK